VVWFGGHADSCRSGPAAPAPSGDPGYGPGATPRSDGGRRVVGVLRRTEPDDRNGPPPAGRQRSGPSTSSTPGKTCAMRSTVSVAPTSASVSSWRSTSSSAGGGGALAAPRTLGAGASPSTTSA